MRELTRGKYVSDLGIGKTLSPTYMGFELALNFRYKTAFFSVDRHVREMWNKQKNEKNFAVTYTAPNCGACGG